MEQSSENQKIIEEQKQAHSQVCQMPDVRINIAPKTLLLVITQMQLGTASLYENYSEVKFISEIAKQLQSHVEWPQSIELILNEGWEKIIQKVSKQPNNVSNAVSIFNDLVESADDVNADIPVIADMEREYGSNFERMSQMEKIHFINVICFQIYGRRIWSEPLDKIWEFAERINNTISKRNDVIALLKRLINSL